MDLIHVKSQDSPLNPNTAYKYHSLKKYPSLLIKVAGKLYVDRAEFIRMAKQTRAAQVKEAKRIAVI